MGNVQGAIAIFKEALAMLRQLLVAFEEAMEVVSPDPSMNVNYVPDFRPHLRAIPLMRDVAGAIVCFNENPFYLFDRAVVFSDHQLASSQEFIKWASAVDTYNLGLAYHLLGHQDGKRNGHKQRRNFDIALTFYKMMFAIMKAEPDAID